MELTKDTDLSSFVGGQLEVQNSQEGYLFRGEIRSLRVEGEGQNADLTVELNWMAKGEGYPPGPSRWVKSENRPYTASLMVYSASEIGEGRLCLQSSILGEVTVLFPAGGSTLDRSKVEGL